MSPMETRLEILVELDLRAIRPVQARLRTFCARHNVETRIVAGLELAADEILSNIIRHAHGVATDIRCITDIADDQVTIVFSDNGAPFDPLTEAPAPNLTSGPDAAPIGGLGVHIVKELSDDCRYSRVDDRNRLEFCWKPSDD